MDWPIVQDVLPFLEQFKFEGVSRGDFRLLDARKLDLPRPRRPRKTEADVNKRCPWIATLPPQVAEYFYPSGVARFTDSLLSPLGFALTNDEITRTRQSPTLALPAPKVYALPGNYEKVLDQADEAGMLTWSLVEQESSSFKSLAEKITMTSFAVTKNESRDRLISWPRAQNELLPDAPHVHLPSPALFSKLRVDPGSEMEGFYFDIDNMFHNILLPPHLTQFFPLHTAFFGTLPARLQHKLQVLFGLRPRQRDLVRPFQRTLPMGFKWAVYLAHTFAHECFMKGISIFRSLTASTPGFHLNRIYTATEERGIIRLKKGDALFFQIIDDVNFAANSWPQRAIVMLHRCVWSQFTKAHLFSKDSKSLPLGKIETECLPFLGWEWSLKTGQIHSRPDRLCQAIQGVLDVLEQTTALTSDTQPLQQAVGRLIWQALGHRPLLAVFASVFQAAATCRVPPSEKLILSARRELAICAALTPLIQVSTQRPYWNTVLCFDASNAAGAVVYSHATNEEIESAVSQWYSVYTAQGRSRQDSGLRQLRYRAFISTFIRVRDWKLAFAHQWTRLQHINALEAEAYVMAMQWATSFNVIGRSVLFISDSQVVIGACTKGRSSSPRLCLPCRRIAALSIAHDMDPFLTFVPSDLNPAEGPSRLGQGIRQPPA